MSKSIIFDTETTGLEEEDRIIQVGAITVDSRDKNYSVLHNELCSSEIPIKIEAMSTHGIRQVQVDGKPSFKESDFFKHINELNSKENYLIAHNLDFDLGMLKKEGFDNKMQLIDTLQCAKHVFEIGDEINGYKVPNHKLQTFRYMMLSQENEDEEAKKYGVEIRAHDAIGDVIILKLFLRELVKRVMQEYGLKNYIEVMNKLVQLTKEPIPPNKIILSFGKHKGKSVEEIFNNDKSWLQWYENTEKPQKEIIDAFRILKNKNNTVANNAINF
jgi:DNA polymerase-3 subunit epsilon/exodeoxyribonuclease X